MFKLSAIVLLLSAVYYTRCLPASIQTSDSDSKAAAGQKLQFYVHNGTEAVNSTLAPVIHQLEVEEQEINLELNALLPFLNFLFDPDKSGNRSDYCLDQLEVQFVQDD